jgi:hypothetical protein
MNNSTDIFVAGLQALARQASDASARAQGIMSLGDIRRALSAVPGTTPVVLDTGGHPGDVDSYRGYYERLAIAQGDPITAAEFVKVLDDADGSTFMGYKGGEYTMHSGTFVHVAEYGDCGRAVVGVHVDGDVVVIETEGEEW